MQAQLLLAQHLDINPHRLQYRDLTPKKNLPKELLSPADAEEQTHTDTLGNGGRKHKKPALTYQFKRTMHVCSIDYDPVNQLIGLAVINREL
jgi:hypothetical protein